eukprot:CAMPEP_0113906226 /NCGR_PEP_ID=MMETSP0780_2-20120614/24593_1 /TAXON_ID=652834 /ORGANISM="Palpitomonas bilix" /LENGTH=224 /DNA_ID=CAMNT_0000900729 /DNA_START=105 /DNA_END=779 /DNA_ORIENTATION=- /assembly_acc=CAM_ASM_000599
MGATTLKTSGGVGGATAVRSYSNNEQIFAHPASKVEGEEYTEEIVQTILERLESAKVEDVEVFRPSSDSPVTAEVVILGSGRSIRHVTSAGDAVAKDIKQLLREKSESDPAIFGVFDDDTSNDMSEEERENMWKKLSMEEAEKQYEEQEKERKRWMKTNKKAQHRICVNGVKTMSNWVVIEANRTLTHILTKDARDLYHLEGVLDPSREKEEYKVEVEEAQQEK